MLNEFNAYLEEQVKNKSIYVLGAQGQTGAQITEAWIKMREHNIEKNYSRAIALWKKNIAAGYTALRAFDCSGLGMYWLNATKLITGDLTAHGMYSKCDPITRDQIKVGDWVFRKNSLGRKYHIGYVVEDGVIESKGRDYGVIKAPFDGKYWNCYGRPRIFKSEIESEDTDVINGNSATEIIADYQQKLSDAGYQGDMDPAKFGSWGSKTEAATKALQYDYGIPQTGEADAATMLALCDALKDAAVDVLDAELTDALSRLSAIANLAGKA